MTEWMPIETAPKDGTRVLLYWPNYSDCVGEIGEPVVMIGQWKENPRIAGTPVQDRLGMSPAYWATSDELDDYGLARAEHYPTHWMPLPTPPKGEK